MTLHLLASYLRRLPVRGRTHHPDRFGIQEFHHVAAYGLDLEPEKSEAIMAEACEKARALARDF